MKSNNVLRGLKLSATTVLIGALATVSAHAATITSSKPITCSGATADSVMIRGVARGSTSHILDNVGTFYVYLGHTSVYVTDYTNTHLGGYRQAIISTTGTGASVQSNSSYCTAG